MCSLCKRPLSTVLRVKPQIISPGSHFARLFRTNPVFLQNNETPIANVFDRKAKFYQRERAAQVLTTISGFNRMQLPPDYRTIPVFKCLDFEWHLISGLFAVNTQHRFIWPICTILDRILSNILESRPPV